MNPIILASASPRRAELLRQIEYEPIVIPAEVDEEAIRREQAADLVRALAQAKLEAVCARLEEEADRRVALLPVLAADTVVTRGDRILEKPTDRADASSMLSLLSGGEHAVMTGVAVRFPGEREPVVAHAETVVTFADINSDEIDWYLDRGEWRDVAGAYRIQGVAARFISSIRGSYSNVVGLPLHLVYSILMGQRP
ncbi:MAG: Maf family protein [Spirochaetales bacterium]